MKIFLKVLFILFLVNQTSQANPKLYQYSGDMPFIEMMLNMMTTMGMIDKVPPNFLAYGNQFNNPYSANKFQRFPNFNAGKAPTKTVSNQLNGVWISQQRQILAIKDQKFLWTDSRSRYLTGQIVARENVLSLKREDNGVVINYQYQLGNMFLQTRNSKGVVTKFIRMPMNSGGENTVPNLR